MHLKWNRWNAAPFETKGSFTIDFERSRIPATDGNILENPLCADRAITRPTQMTFCICAMLQSIQI